MLLSAMYAAGRKCHQQFYPHVKPVSYKYEWCGPRYPSDVNIMGVNNSFLIGFKIHSTGKTTWHHKYGQVLTSGELMGSSRESTTIILQNEHRIKVPSKFVSPYP